MVRNSQFDAPLDRSDGLYGLTVYITWQELSNLVKGKLSVEQQKEFDRDMFIPVNVQVNPIDQSIEATLVVAK